jgi:hypothetical protein
MVAPPQSHSGLRIRNAPTAGIFYGFDILIQRPVPRLERWRSPGLSAASKFVFWHLQVDSIFDGIHRDCISIVDKCNRPAYLCFWNNVANYEPMGAMQKQWRRNAQSGTNKIRGWMRCSPSTKPSISQAGHILAKPCTHNQTCGFEHFWHA